MHSLVHDLRDVPRQTLLDRLAMNKVSASTLCAWCRNTAASRFGAFSFSCPAVAEQVIHGLDDSYEEMKR